MSTALTDSVWHDDEGLQRWLVIPDDVDPTATHATLNLEQLDSGWIWPTIEEPTTAVAVEQALTASGWHLGGPWRTVTPARTVVAVTREPTSEHGHHAHE